MRRETDPFLKAGRRAMRFQMGGVYHDPVGFRTFARHFPEETVNMLRRLPADKAVIDRLVWTILRRRIGPARTVPDDKHDPADNPQVVNPRNTV